MITFDDFESVKRQVDKAQRERDKSLGVIEELKKSLKENFGCDNEEEATALLDEMKKEEQRLLRLWNKKFTAFKKKWGEKLKEMET